MASVRALIVAAAGKLDAGAGYSNFEADESAGRASDVFGASSSIWVRVQADN